MNAVNGSFYHERLLPTWLDLEEVTWYCETVVGGDHVINVEARVSALSFFLPHIVQNIDQWEYPTCGLSQYPMPA